MIGCLLNPVSCFPDWLTFILGYWEWLLASFLLGLGIGALAGWKGLLVALTGGLALKWLWRRPASEPAWETGEPHRPIWGNEWKRRHRPEIGPRGTWQRQNPGTGKWVDE